MTVSQRTTTGYKVEVEYRPSANMYFVVFPEEEIELAPAFMLRDTAWEIAAHSSSGTPFFTMIPSVPYKTCWPRPGILMPKIKPISLRIPEITRDY